MPWGYAAVAAATVGSGLLSSNAAKGAAKTQSNADIAAQQTQKDMFNTIVGQEQPFLKTGDQASWDLRALSSPGGYLSQKYQPLGAFNPNMIKNMPGYKFQMQQGDQAIQNQDSGTVGALSGTALKDLSSFNQGLAGTYENQYFNQYLAQQGQGFNQFQTQQNNIFNRLSNIASMGQNAAANLGSQGATLGTGVAQAQAAQGGALAAGQVGSANAWSGALNSGVPLAILASQNPGGQQQQSSYAAPG